MTALELCESSLIVYPENDRGHKLARALKVAIAQLQEEHDHCYYDVKKDELLSCLAEIDRIANE